MDRLQSYPSILVHFYMTVTNKCRTHIGSSGSSSKQTTQFSSDYNYVQTIQITIKLLLLPCLVLPYTAPLMPNPNQGLNLPCSALTLPRPGQANSGFTQPCSVSYSDIKLHCPVHGLSNPSLTLSSPVPSSPQHGSVIPSPACCYHSQSSSHPIPMFSPNLSSVQFCSDHNKVATPALPGLTLHSSSYAKPHQGLTLAYPVALTLLRLYPTMLPLLLRPKTILPLACPTLLRPYPNLPRPYPTLQFSPHPISSIEFGYRPLTKSSLPKEVSLKK